MGFSLSWIAVKAPKDKVLSWMSLADTGEKDVAMKAPYCGAQLPGWYLVVAQDIEFAKHENVFNLSRECEALGCSVEDENVISSVFLYKDMSPLWRIEFVGGDGIGEEGLDVDGAPPPQWAAIWASQIAKQKLAGGGSDHYFAAPFELAKALCGFRHGETKFDWGEVNFTVLEDAAPPVEKPGGWFKKMFGS